MADDRQPGGHTGGDEAPVADAPGERTPRLRAALRWMVRPPRFTAVVLALVFFALAMTPSLIPRSWNTQGVLAGLAAAIGYGVGSGLAALVHLAVAEPDAATMRRAWLALAVAGPIALVGSVWAGAVWDGELRQRMEMPIETPWNWVGVVVVGAATAVLLIVIARLARATGHLLVLLAVRLVPRPVAVALGGAVAAVFLVYVVLGGLTESVFAGVDASARVWDRTVQDDIDPPASPMKSGSADSLIAWEDLGSKGREFTAEAPTVEEIAAFTGRPAMDPIRVYGGMRTAASLDERLDLVMAELDRTNAWDRSVIIVQTPSGNGEVGRINLAAPEYMFGGDIAQVAVQYGYAGSFTTMLTKPGAGDDAAAAIIGAVRDRLDALPEDGRPRLFVAGESLGSLSTEAAFEDLDDMAASVDGALMIGPTLVNKIRNDIIDHRDEGSPVWLPVFHDGEVVRFAQDPSDIDVPTGDWGDTRILYLSNASDPVAWYDPALALRPPEFLDDPRGPDVSDDMVWMPFVTFWQVVADLPFASGAPVGHGHRYLENIVDGWAAVLQPPGWTEDDTQRLRTELSSS